MTSSLPARATRAAVLIAFFRIAWPVEAVCGEDPTMNDRDHLFDLIERTVALRPFRPEPVAGVLGVDLAVDEEVSNPYMTVYRPTEIRSLHLEDVELRIPTEEATAIDGLVILTIAPTLEIEQSDVLGSFGEEPELGVPTPRQPEDSLIYLIYRVDWGLLRFGFSRVDEERLVTVVMDATEGPHED